MRSIVSLLTAMSCRVQMVSVVASIQSLLSSHVASHGADREYSCTHSIAAMLNAMSCRMQDVSVLVHIQLLLCSLLCRVTRSP